LQYSASGTSWIGVASAAADSGPRPRNGILRQFRSIATTRTTLRQGLFARLFGRCGVRDRERRSLQSAVSLCSKTRPADAYTYTCMQRHCKLA
jgi:hypothetical protein